MVGVPAEAFELGSQLDLTATEALVVESFGGQRRRLHATATELTEAEWASATRCSAWDSRQLLLHVVGATGACRTTLTGAHSVFGGGFDPNAGPSVFVDSRADQPVASILDDLAREIDGAAVAITALQGEVPVPTRTAVWGAEVDWRLFVAHMFWDAWMHERDLLVPLGIQPATTDAETRLAAAYGLHTAGIMIGLLGTPLDATLRLDGVGGGTYRVEVDGLNVVISVDPRLPLDDEPSQGDAIDVIDALAGRGVELTDVLDADADIVDALAQVGDFLRGQAAAPPLPG
jgi:uncharacterized protein (TIGR03083 family)